METYLEKIIKGKSFDEIGNWQMPGLEKFSKKKELFYYQKDALKNITLILKEYFSVFDKTENINLSDDRKSEEAKRYLFNLCVAEGLDRASFEVWEKTGRKGNQKINQKFKFFSKYFNFVDEITNKKILGYQFFNQASFWMATGSGKSLVLIKTIELLDYLQGQGLIPKREIMLLLPREDLIKQFKEQVEEFNQGRNKKIDLIHLKNYEQDKFSSLDFGNSIKVYYGRSDLLQNERKEKILDYKTYLNNGEWYVFLDEAHRGEKGNSLMQDYIKVLSKNGFLFNFSATFTDEIDKVSTCYNFNLEKFIEADYGKNIYLSNAYFDFKKLKAKDDFSENEKQKQVLKSLLTFTLVKKSKKKNLYHDPLLMTLVNSVNTEDSDLLLFFRELEKIASGDLKKENFIKAKEDLLKDFRNYDEFVFGNEKLKFDLNKLEKLKIDDLFKSVFNAKNHGKIEILEGEKGKEIVLKLETSEKPFALIKIGDSKKFQKETLGRNYKIIESFENKKYFKDLNQNGDINLLIGSRVFYEGWDSNRPNVINLINIGWRGANKFVLQGIGRGVRIEPGKFKNQPELSRKRLAFNDEDKNILLETLFIFATDKKSVQTILEQIDEQKVSKDEVSLELELNQNIPFDLLIPVYKENQVKEDLKFNISKESLKRFLIYLNNFDTNTLLLKYGLKEKDFEKIKKETYYKISKDSGYSDMELLLFQVVYHKKIRNKVVDRLKKIDNEIIHFKHIKVKNFSDEEVKSLKEKIEKVKNFKKIGKKEIEERIKKGEISFDEALKLGNAKNEESFKDLKIKKLAQHYYLPLIYSEKEKIDYIKHIINIESEVKFIKNLEKFIKENELKKHWMFSKIDESLDKKLGMPYFTKDNFYRDFYPDFIFWIKDGDDYRIIFIDPKGGSQTVSEKKIDGFKKLFEDKNGNKKEFEFNQYKITFELYFVGDWSGGEAYERYWLKEGDFSFIIDN